MSTITEYHPANTSWAWNIDASDFSEVKYGVVNIVAGTGIGVTLDIISKQIRCTSIVEVNTWGYICTLFGY